MTSLRNAAIAAAVSDAVPDSDPDSVSASDSASETVPESVAESALATPTGASICKASSPLVKAESANRFPFYLMNTWVLTRWSLQDIGVAWPVARPSCHDAAICWQECPARFRTVFAAHNESLARGPAHSLVPMPVAVCTYRYLPATPSVRILTEASR